ncbi:hypothetical protein AB1Y20_002829 [Prymnesium parvum]|uniref:CW-type domain-containing protein n=1 Tax=Prymnesium parvum TaxID=97485 RepID=A0AB34JA89_PRYPA
MVRVMSSRNGHGAELPRSARGLVCALSHMPSWRDHPEHGKEQGADGGLLSLMHGGWCGPSRGHGVPSSCEHKVTAFVIARPAVLHVDEILNNKKDPLQVRFLLHRLIKQRVPVQVAFLQGALPLQQPDLFPRLLNFLTQCPVWSVNLGELRFSEAQCKQLAETLRKSGVTHMFYECTVAGQWKDIYRGIIRANRAKHGMWRLGPDAEQNKVVLAAVKNWFVPTAHSVNKQWMQRHRAGEGSSREGDRIQCEACGRWRRLPARHHLERMEHITEFYCAMNSWDTRFASCRTAEEDWSRGAPVAGDDLMLRVGEGRWVEARLVGGTPTAPQLHALQRQQSLETGDEAVLHSFNVFEMPLVQEGGRARKKPELYVADSCTQMSKQLRRLQSEEDARRKASRLVQCVGGETRLALLTAETRYEDWVFPWEWVAKRAQLLMQSPPPTVGVGTSVMIKVDGKAWRRFRVVSRISERQLARLQELMKQPTREESHPRRRHRSNADGSSAPTAIAMGSENLHDLKCVSGEASPSRGGSVASSSATSSTSVAEAHPTAAGPRGTANAALCDSPLARSASPQPTAPSVKFLTEYPSAPVSVDEHATAHSACDILPEANQTVAQCDENHPDAAISPRPIAADHMTPSASFDDAPPQEMPGTDGQWNDWWECHNEEPVPGKGPLRILVLLSVETCYEVWCSAPKQKDSRMRPSSPMHQSAKRLAAVSDKGKRFFIVLKLKTPKESAASE